MRSPAVVVVALALLLWPETSRADPEPGLALFSAAAINLGGFIVGGSLLATSRGSGAQNGAGWLVIESGFTVAPLAAHGLMNEWRRGALFAAAPGSALALTAGLFAADPLAVERGELSEQRWLWGLFGAGLLTSAAGVVDALLAPSRKRMVSLAPVIGAGLVGLRIGGTL